GCTQGMHTEAMYVCINADHGTVMLHNVLVDRIRMQMLRQNFGDVVLDRPKERTIEILLVRGDIQILCDESLRFEAHRDVAYLVAFAMDTKVQHAFALLQITHTKPT